MLIGARLSARRPRRLALATASTAITASGIMAIIAWRPPSTPGVPPRSPGQITAGISVARILPALAGALLGIPGGIGIHDAVKNAGSPVIPPPGWVTAMVLDTVLTAAILTAIPALIDARRPVAEILQAETA